MRPLLPLLLLALSFSTLALAAPPSVTRGGGSITVTNGLYTAVVSERTGVLRRLTTLAFGDRTVINEGFTYSDIGLLKEGSHPFFGSNAAQATVEVKTEGASVSISSEGTLCLQDGTAPAGPKWRYRYRYVFTDTPVVQVTAGLQTDTARAAGPGFLASTLSVSGVNEWFADTPRGMQWVDLGTQEGRCFELRNTPLRPERRRLGLLNHDNGAVVLLDKITSTPDGCLEDVIFHSTGTGSVGVFINWLSGQQQTAFEPGRWYDLSYEVSLTGQLPQ